MAVDSGGGKGFKIADAYVEIHVDDDAAKREVASLGNRLGPDSDRAGRQVGTSVGKGIGKTIGPEAQRSGKSGGDKLSKGMELAIVRNSPLIAAAVGGALAVGAPAVLAASTALFAGVGIAAATQSVKVRSAWSDTWDEVRDGTVSAAGPIEDTLVGLADRVGDHFAAMQPKIADAFAASAPLIDDFADGVLNAAENALPGLVRAVERGQAVTEGFASLLRDTGTGVSDMFDAISTHSGAAGDSIGEVGHTVGILLPLLGEFVGQGAELASNVLPLMNSGLGLALKVTQLLGPALPAVVQGIGALKIAQAAGGWIGGAADKLTGFANNMKAASWQSELARSGIRNVADGMGALSQQTGALTAVVGATLIVWENANEQGRQWADMLIQGGDAAQQARAQMSDFGTAAAETNQGFAGFIAGLGGVATVVGGTAIALKEGRDQAKAYRDSLDPVARAAYDVKVAEADLADAVHDHGINSDQARAAMKRYEDATRDNERAQGELETALHGVTTAMIEQADQALAAIDSGFAYRHSMEQLDDSLQNLRDVQSHLNDTNKDTRTSLGDLNRAQLDVEESTFRAAEAYARQQADLSDLKEGSAEYNRLIQTETLKRLTELQSAAGPEMAAAIQQQIDKLEAAGVSLDELDSKSASPDVSVDDGPFQSFIARGLDQLRNLDAQRPNPVAGLGIDLLTGHYSDAMGKMGNLHRQRPDPVATLETGPLAQWYNFATGRLNTLNNMRPNPVASLTDRASGPALNIVDIIGRIRDKYVTVTVAQQFIGASASGSVPFGADGGSIEDLFAGADRYDSGGAVRGRGGPRDDLVPAIGPRGAPARLSNGEHVLDALDVNLMGGQSGVYRFRDLLNRGAIDVPGMVNGGGGRSITVQQLSVNVTGTFDLRDPGAVRKFAVAVAPAVRDALVEEEAKYR